MAERMRTRAASGLLPLTTFNFVKYYIISSSKVVFLAVIKVVLLLVVKVVLLAVVKVVSLANNNYIMIIIVPAICSAGGGSCRLCGESVV